MKFKTLFILTAFALLICSCSGSRKGTKSTSPYLTEETQKDITVRREAVKPIDNTDKTVYRYYVIIGSFEVIGNARQFKTDLIKDGFSPVILENENGLFRVSVGAFNEEKAARNKIAQIRTNYRKYEDVWLLIRK